MASAAVRAPEKGFAAPSSRGTRPTWLTPGNVAFVGAILGLTVVRILLAANQSYFAFVPQLYDDGLQVQLADYLAQGDWLGPYGSRTLLKGVAYPWFLSVIYRLGVPYGVAMGFVIVLSGLVFLAMLRGWTRNHALLVAAFALVCFCPVAYGDGAGLRIYRNALVPWLALSLFSSLCALVRLRRAPASQSVPWLLNAGLALAFLLNLREDGVWMYPSIAGVMAVCLIARFRTKASLRNKLCYSALLLVPFVLCVGAYALVSGVNYERYGVFHANDRTEGAFAEMVGDITLIADDEKSPEEQWFTRAMLDKAVEVSPTLQSISSEIDASYDRWAGEQGIVKGDFLQWVMLVALDNAGVFDSATHVQEFCGKVVEELDQAFADGRLAKDGLIHPSAQGPGLTLEQLLGYVPLTFEHLVSFADWGWYGDYVAPYPDESEQVAQFERLTGLSLTKEAIGDGTWADAVERALIKLYQLIGAPLFLGAVVLTVFWSVRSGRGDHRLLIGGLACVAALLGGAFVNAYMVTVFGLFLAVASVPLYGSPTFMLLVMFEGLALCLWAGKREAEPAARPRHLATPRRP